MAFTQTNFTALYFNNDSTPKYITDISNQTLTQDDIANTTNSFNYTFADIIGITISTDVEKLQDFLFTDCLNLTNIVIYNTDILSYIGSHIFDDVSTNGTFTFYSKQATTLPKTYYYTQNIDRLTHLLRDVKPVWKTNLKYTHSTDFGILCNDLTFLNKTNTEYYDFVPIDISYSDFHSLFFLNNRYFNLTPPNIAKTKISASNLAKYTVINRQVMEIYPDNLSKSPSDVSFNLYSNVLNHYQYCIPYQSWSIESKMQLNKQLSKLNTIYDFLYNIRCASKKNDHCNSSCQEKNNTKITLDELFNIYEAQGVVMATDNSYNGIPINAQGLPLDASFNKYTAVLTLYLRSNNSNVNDISLRIPYLINFAGSMPKSVGDKNYYRYNP